MTNQDRLFLKALGADQPVPKKITLDLDHQGYTILENMIDPHWLEQLQNAFDVTVAQEGESIAIEHHTENTAIRLANLVNKGVIWEKIWCHPLLMAIARHVFAGSFKLSSLNAREALPGGGHQPLHADWKQKRDDFPKVHVMNSIWALDELTLTNGSPRVVPGTHLDKQVPEDVLDDPEVHHPDQIIATCPAGSVVIFNAHLWHGGTRNRSGARRRVLHSYFTRRENPQQQNQQHWLKKSTRKRLTPAQKWLLDVL